MQILRRFLAVSPPIVRFSSAMFAHFVNTQMLFSLSPRFSLQNGEQILIPLCGEGEGCLNTSLISPALDKRSLSVCLSTMFIDVPRCCVIIPIRRKAMELDNNTIRVYSSAVQSKLKPLLTPETVFLCD